MSRSLATLDLRRFDSCVHSCNSRTNDIRGLWNTESEFLIFFPVGQSIMNNFTQAILQAWKLWPPEWNRTLTQSRIDIAAAMA